MMLMLKMHSLVGADGEADAMSIASVAAFQGKEQAYNS